MKNQSFPSMKNPYLAFERVEYGVVREEGWMRGEWRVTKGLRTE